MNWMIIRNERQVRPVGKSSSQLSRHEGARVRKMIFLRDRCRSEETETWENERCGELSVTRAATECKRRNGMGLHSSVKNLERG
jgi:hypothetical protein